MDFLGIGPMEILLILVVALIAFGPKKLPKIGRDVGKAMSSFKKAASEISEEVSKELKELEEEEGREGAAARKGVEVARPTESRNEVTPSK